MFFCYNYVINKHGVAQGPTMHPILWLLKVSLCYGLPDTSWFYEGIMAIMMTKRDNSLDLLVLSPWEGDGVCKVI